MRISALPFVLLVWANGISAFVVKHHQTRSSALAATLESQPQQRSSQQYRPVRPVFVVGEVPAAMGASLALNCFQVLTGQMQIPADQRGSPPQQPVSLFNANSIDKLTENIGLYSNTEPILHVFVGATGDGVGILRDPEVRAGISYLGVQPSPWDTQGPLVSLETAQMYSPTLKEVLSNLSPRNNNNSPGQPVVFLTMELSLHLALLNGNVLPKSTANQDSFHVLMPEGGSIVVNYLYDTKSFGMGTDPLSCKTKETVISTPPTFSTAKRSSSSAAAYTALRGNGMDEISSAAVAAACATMLGDDAARATSISWSTVEKACQLARHIRQYGAVDNPGALRKQYTAYGYK
ncbi:expressed unknown protein [Seminavis robusta]|uniref:Uncharacterized protein n=1 Tax=Seminavis robusta TaxID=568900 RepID=A0A9N8HCI3_9STRA|nr:expressed unknown protein [Seminavis robusta]|eukprot:Sro219_g090340.1 n/a (349) ;mRNA; f:18911-19957